MSAELIRKAMNKYPPVELDVSSLAALHASMKKDLEQDKKRYKYYERMIEELAE